MEALGCLASKPMWFTFVLHSFYGCISGHRSTLYPEIWSASWAIWHQGAIKVIFHLIQTHSFIGPSANLKGPHNSSLIFIFYFLFWSCEGLKIKQIYSWYILEIFYPSQSSSKREERDSVSFLTNRMQQRTGKFSGRSKLLSRVEPMRFQHHKENIEWRKKAEVLLLHRWAQVQVKAHSLLGMLSIPYSLSAMFSLVTNFNSTSAIKNNVCFFPKGELIRYPRQERFIFWLIA